MTSHPPPDPIPEPIRELLVIYRDALPEVSFPDADLEMLMALADRWRENAARLEHLSSELDAARTALDETRSCLDRAARRALGYALVYAADEPVLLEQLRATGLEPPGAAAPAQRKARRRRTKPRAVPSADELPFDAARTA